MRETNYDLQGFDMVVAMTQFSINNRLNQFFFETPKSIALYCNRNDAGELVPSEVPDEAQYAFTADVYFGTEVKDYVVLSLPADNTQRITYRAFLSNGYFKANETVIEEATDALWILNFLVDLEFVEMDQNAIDSNILATMQSTIEQLDDEPFSIDALFMNLNTAVLNAFEGVDGLDDYKDELEAMMLAYLEEQQQDDGPIFGYNLRSAAGELIKASQKLPNTIDYVISRYKDKDGSYSDTDLDTLCYLMTLGDAKTDDVPHEFDFNWVEDVIDDGAMALVGTPFLKWAAETLEPAITYMYPKLSHEADAQKSPDNQSLVLETGTNTPSFNYHMAGSSIASWGNSRNPTPSTDSHSTYSPTAGPVLDNKIDIDAYYEGSCTVSLTDDMLNITGTCMASASVLSQKKNPKNKTMPETTFPWELNMRYKCDTDHPGVLYLDTSTQNFSLAIHVAGSDHNSWAELKAYLDMSTETWSTIINMLDGIRIEIRDKFTGLKPTLKEGMLANVQVVFPGTTTFRYSAPFFTDQYIFISTLNYEY